MNRRQKRQRQKQVQRQEPARTSAKLPKPQPPKQRQRSSPLSQGGSAGSRFTINAGESRPLTPRRKDKRSVSSSSQAKAKRKTRRRNARSTSGLVYATRLLILAVGIGAIAGTIFSAWEPNSRHPAGAIVTAPNPEQQTILATPSPVTPPPSPQEILSLKAQIQAVAAKYPHLQPAVFILDLETGAYLDLQATEIFSAASTIKLPILIAFFQDVDAGKIQLEEQLTMLPESIASGSGNMQYQKPGKKFTALETASKMITISDNTATNMLISRLGGAEVLNQRFRSWGLTATAINNPLPDLEGTNTTSPKELATLIARVNEGELVSTDSQERLLDIMHRTVRNTLLPRGLGKGATIAHKTGDIGSMIADVGLIDMPSGKRYIAAVMVKRPHNDRSAQKLIQQISRTAYQYFSQPAAIPNSTSSPPVPSAPVIGALSKTRPYT